MKNYNILMTKNATNDLIEITKYISNEILAPYTAKKLLKNIRVTVTNLAQMPTRHALVNDKKLALQGIRQLLVDNYIVFYIVSEKSNTVTVIRILYSRRDWADLL